MALFDLPQAEPPGGIAPAVGYQQRAGPVDSPIPRQPSATAACPPSPSDEVVVCGKRNDEQYRLHPLPPAPDGENPLSTPMRVTLAPGVTLGFQQGGGFGLSAQFGRGARKGEEK
jgi:hypothetical protein